MAFHIECLRAAKTLSGVECDRRYGGVFTDVEEAIVIAKALWRSLKRWVGLGIRVVDDQGTEHWIARQDAEHLGLDNGRTR